MHPTFPKSWLSVNYVKTVLAVKVLKYNGLDNKLQSRSQWKEYQSVRQATVWIRPLGYHYIVQELDADVFVARQSVMWQLWPLEVNLSKQIRLLHAVDLLFVFNNCFMFLIFSISRIAQKKT